MKRVVQVLEGEAALRTQGADGSKSALPCPHAAIIIAQQVSKEVKDAIAPFQHALKTKSRCECVSHGIQSKMHHHVCGWCQHF